MASALQLPLAGCSSLDLLAHPHRRDGRLVASVIDARRGEVFWALYEPVEGSVRRIAGPSVRAPAELAGELSEVAGRRRGLLVTGDGARRYAAELSGCALIEVAPPEFDDPSPDVLASLAPGIVPVRPEELEPLYLRGADVRIGWERRDG
jgi:tRNA threonylcarbamoyladenosine biosynthesis protein TsaB